MAAVWPTGRVVRAPERPAGGPAGGQRVPARGYRAGVEATAGTPASTPVVPGTEGPR